MSFESSLQQFPRKVAGEKYRRNHVDERHENEQEIDDGLAAAKHGDIEPPELHGLIVDIRHGANCREFIRNVKREIDAQAGVHQTADFGAAFLFEAIGRENRRRQQFPHHAPGNRSLVLRSSEA